MSLRKSPQSQLPPVREYSCFVNQSEWGCSTYAVLWGLIFLMQPVYGFFDDHIPPQKMVMSPYRPAGAMQKLATNTHQTVAETEPVDETDIASDPLVPALQANHAAIDTQKEATHNKANQTAVDHIDTLQSRPNPAPSHPQHLNHLPKQAVPNQATDTLADGGIAPYQIIPEVGQKPEATQAKIAALPKLPPKQQGQKPQQQFAFDRVMRWVSEVGVAMLTYSSDHLSRDQKNVAQYFSPQAWQTVDQTLFQGKNSPFRNIVETHANTRAIAVDWPKALHMDVTEQGKIWWLSVPLMAEVKTAKRSQRYAYQIKFGVLPIQEANEVRFLVNEVVIKAVSPPSRAPKRGRR